MAIDAEHEELMTLTEAAKLLPRVNGRRVAVSTLWRWCRKGLRGVHLEYLRMGRNIVTSRAALYRFFTGLVEQDGLEAERRYDKPECLRGRRPVSAQARQRALEEADAILEEAGI